MPDCGCKRNVVWDWCQDAYRYQKTGQFLPTVEKAVVINGGGTDIIFTQCLCGAILSISTMGENGWDIFNADSWAGSGVEWDTDENSFNPNDVIAYSGMTQFDDCDWDETTDRCINCAECSLSLRLLRFASKYYGEDGNGPSPPDWVFQTVSGDKSWYDTISICYWLR